MSPQVREELKVERDKIVRLSKGLFAAIDRVLHLLADVEREGDTTPIR